VIGLPSALDIGLGGKRLRRGIKVSAVVGGIVKLAFSIKLPGRTRCPVAIELDGLRVLPKNTRSAPLCNGCAGYRLRRASLTCHLREE
jgi:hypothetical protein